MALFILGAVAGAIIYACHRRDVRRRREAQLQQELHYIELHKIAMLEALRVYGEERIR